MEATSDGLVGVGVGWLIILGTASIFRDRITADGSSGFKAEAGRYHLYVALICPWASRTLIADIASSQVVDFVAEIIPTITRALTLRAEDGKKRAAGHVAAKF